MLYIHYLVCTPENTDQTGKPRFTQIMTHAGGRVSREYERWNRDVWTKNPACSALCTASPLTHLICLPGQDGDAVPNSWILYILRRKLSLPFMTRIIFVAFYCLHSFIYTIAFRVKDYRENKGTTLLGNCLCIFHLTARTQKMKCLNLAGVCALRLKRHQRISEADQ